MSLTLYPRYHPARRVLLNRPLVNVAARRADAVITVSHSAKRDIVRLYDLDPARVHVIHEAAAPSFRRITEANELARVRRHYGLGDRIILYVGTVEPRKNLPLLIQAFAERRRRGDLTHQLVCVGPYGWLSRDIQTRIDRCGAAAAINFTGYVPFADLPALYSLADMFVFPSVYEGFGLPVVEAMACGTPVVTGPTSALEEVAGGAMEHVEVLDVQALGDAMVRLARDPDRREELSMAGSARARQFSWRRAALETLDVYRHAARCPAGATAADPKPAFADVGVDRVASGQTVRESQGWMR
jgi:glycosyltransferase involved in cell wall biosynthesis